MIRVASSTACVRVAPLRSALAGVVRAAGERKVWKRNTAKAQNHLQKRAQSQPSGWLLPAEGPGCTS